MVASENYAHYSIENIFGSQSSTVYYYLIDLI